MFRTLLLIGLVTLALERNAFAQLLDFTFSGTIDVASGGGTPSVWDSVQVGDPFTITYRVDPPADPFPLAQSVTYPNVVVQVDITIGGAQSSEAISGSSARVINNAFYFGGCHDHFSLRADGTSSYSYAYVSLDAYAQPSACPLALISGAFPPALNLGSFPSNSTLALDSVSGYCSGTIASAVVTSVPVASVPVNDDCANAIALPSTFATTAFDATNATTDGVDAFGFCDYGPFGDEQSYNDIWFTYSPPVSGCTYISTLGLVNYDNRLTVYGSTGCPDDPLDIIACVDDEMSPPTPPWEAGLDVYLSVSETYLIRIGSFNDNPAGGGLIHIAAGPGADLTSGGQNPGAPGCTSPPSNDDCTSAQAATVGLNPFDSRAATDGAGLELDPLVCSFGSFFGDDQLYQDVWFSFTPPQAGTYDFSVVANGSTPFQSRIAVYDQSTCPDAPANVIGCARGSVPYIPNLGLSAVNTYLIRVGSNDATTVEHAAALFIGLDGPPPPNDDCPNSQIVGLGLSAFNATSATDGIGLALDTQVCTFGGFTSQIHYDVWFSYAPTTSGFYDIGVVNAGNLSFDSRIAIYDQSTCPDDPANVIACDDNSGPLGEAFIYTVQLNSGTSYAIRAGAYGPSTPVQPAALSIAVGSSPPANDDCANAIALPSSFADTPYDARSATTDGANSIGFCDYGAPGSSTNWYDVWFTYTPSIGGCTYISTLNRAGYDTRLTIYDSTSCPDDPTHIIACVDTEVIPAMPPFEAGLDVDLAQGRTYLIRLGTGSVDERAGIGTLRIAQGAVATANSGGMNPGAPGCRTFTHFCTGDGGNQVGCTNCPCANNATPGSGGGCLNSAGTGALLFVSGSTSVSLPPGDVSDLRLGLLGVPPGAFCILSSGDSLAPANPMNPCFGLDSGAQAMAFDGLRCAVMNTRRHGGRGATAAGSVGITNNPWGGEAPPLAGIAVAGAGFAAGQTRYFQAINRDDSSLSCMRGLNTSQAIRLTFTN